MIKYCEICNENFETKSPTRIYCYKCSGDSTRLDNTTRKHQKTILRRSMKLQEKLTLSKEYINLQKLT